MTGDANGRKLLGAMNLSGFGALDARVFDSIARNAALAGARVS